MVEAYYITMFILSLLLTLTYSFIWHKHFDVHITLLFVLFPINNLSFLMQFESKTLDELILSIKVSYIGGSYMILMIMLAVFNLCNIKLSRWMRLCFMFITTSIFISSLSIGHNQLFYRGISLSENGVITKDYGVMHTMFTVMVFSYFLISLAAIVYSYFMKNQVSRKMIYLLVLPEAVAITAFFGGRKALDDIELIPAAYVFAQIIYLTIIYRVSLYDVTDTAIDSMVQSGDTGFMSADFKFNYLGSNETAKSIFPELSNLTVDMPVSRSRLMENTALMWLKDFREDASKNKLLYERNGNTYLINITYLYDGRRKRGYQLFITDDTKNQQYIKLINSFNTELKAEVEEKTRHIVEMHDNLIMSMATMVESRDNSTGGHIRRTSEGVRLLLEEMKKDSSFGLTEEFCRNMIKAAPMHDLGKIAVDDAILRKPGRFLPEEYEKMKKHAAEGARIVHEILKGTDDLEFHLLAENVAHYHHERWDGSGYPEGLKGEEIPFEARIMAIADVYDALVSKRVYKEKMSFEQADRIIMEGMGKHFDKRLEPCYVAARPKLEAYYSSLE
ncbi:MAG: HD domain-containing protein [Ruminococcus sp.]|nr:HD domain-containing protein [Ruminococcus sp.]